MVTRILLVLGMSLLSVRAAAQGPGVQEDVTAETRDVPRNYGNLRLGASSSTRDGHPDLCLEVAPVAFLSVESCGTGSGFLHHSPEPQIAHFRTKARLGSVKTGQTWFEPQVAAGFAELQIGEDASGFYFNGTGPGGVETAGPEIGLSLKVVAPLAGGTEIIGDVQANAAWMPHADDLPGVHQEFQPSATVTVGAGF